MLMELYCRIGCVLRVGRGLWDGWILCSGGTGRMHRSDMIGVWRSVEGGKHVAIYLISWGR